MHLSPLLSVVALAATYASGHPGGNHKQEAAEHKRFVQSLHKRDLSHCSEQLKKRGITQRQVTRRQELARSLQAANGLHKRSLDSLNQSHYSDEDYGLSTAPETLFSSNKSCILAPETILGPYYVAGEYVRKNLTEDQQGVPLFVDYQIVDVETCEPIDDVFVEIWAANSTGVYSGVVAEGNGNDNDTSNLDLTWLRGIQHTDAEGIVGFQTIFPGHYSGRTTHIHVITHINATVFHNGTIMNDQATHVGQAFFDQSLIDEIEATYPYTENTVELTTNAEDDILNSAANSSDPLMNYVYLGDSVSDGILAWLEFGINKSAVADASPASYYVESGGYTNPNQSLVI